MIERIVTRLAGKPFASMCEAEKLQWGFLLSWALCFNVAPVVALVAALVLR